MAMAGWLGDWRRAAGEHHERWDGQGYPAGLAGTEISLAGRIIAVADAYEQRYGRRVVAVPYGAELPEPRDAGRLRDLCAIRFVAQLIGNRRDAKLFKNIGLGRWQPDIVCPLATEFITSQLVARA